MTLVEGLEPRKSIKGISSFNHKREFFYFPILPFDPQEEIAISALVIDSVNQRFVEHAQRSLNSKLIIFKSYRVLDW